MIAANARLFINGKDVGGVAVKSLADSWGFGEFTPAPAFAEFSSLFGSWSLLMHADDDERRLSQAASDELRRAELAIDGLKAKLLVTSSGASESDQWVEITQLNIDGPLIEWKVSQRHAAAP